MAPVDRLWRESEHHRLTGALGHLRAFELEQAIVAVLVNGQRKARLDGFDGYLLQVVLSAHISTLGRARHEIRRRHAGLSECSANFGPALAFVPNFLAKFPGIALQELRGPDSGHPNGADPVALHQKRP